MGNGAAKEAGVLGPPVTEDPPTSIRAKALYSFWWTLTPYLSETITGGKNGRVVKVQAGSLAAVVHFNYATKGLVLSFAGSKQLVKKMKVNKPKDLGPGLAPLDFLASAVPKAMVNSALVQGEAKEVLDAALAEVEKMVPAGVKPLSVLCTGYCTGGALAAVAVARLALKYPQADTTCITFGSPFVGNKEFAEVFNLLVGLSFRVKHRGDVFTSHPHHDPWTFPATWDVLCGTKHAAHPRNNHALTSYLNGMLELGEGCQLPRNAPGVYLLVRPQDVNKDKGSDSPWPVDDCFLPADRDAEGLKSPYDAGVELGDGTLCQISDLFKRDSDVWKSMSAKLDNLEISSEDQDSMDMEEEPTARAQDPKHRFVAGYQSASAPSKAAADQPQAAMQGEVGNALAKNKPDEATTPIEYLNYGSECDADLAQKDRSIDLLAAHRLALPMLLARAAYRTSATGKLDKPALSPASDDPEVIKTDPFGGAIQDIKDQILGYRLIDDCEFTYKGDALVKHKVMPAGNKTDTQAYVIWLKDGTAVFAFRGTANMSDWMSNVDFKSNTLGSEEEEVPLEAGSNGKPKKQECHKPGMRGAVHRGFMRGFSAVAYRGDPQNGVSARHLAGVLRELMEAHPVAGLDPKQGPARVMCVGHSLGGALATLGAAWAAGQYPLASVSLYTFGQPRVGDHEFVTHLNTVVGYSARVVHRLDVVPLVPLNSQGFEHYYPAGYLGCSTKERLTAPLRFIHNKSEFYLRLAADKRWGMILLTLMNVPDHFMDSYHECYKVAMKSLGATPVEPTKTQPAGEEQQQEL